MDLLIKIIVLIQNALIKILFYVIIPEKNKLKNVIMNMKIVRNKIFKKFSTLLKIRLNKLRNLKNN